jgi:hypothetical protein
MYNQCDDAPPRVWMVFSDTVQKEARYSSREEAHNAVEQENKKRIPLYFAESSDLCGQQHHECVTNNSTYVIPNVTARSEGKQTPDANRPKTQSVQYHAREPVTMIGVNGILLKNENSIDHQRVIQNGKCNDQEYVRLFVKRLHTAFKVADHMAGLEGRKACITIPRIGCGVYCDPFKKDAQRCFAMAMEHVLTNNTFNNLGMVFIEAFNAMQDDVPLPIVLSSGCVVCYSATGKNLHSRDLYDLPGMLSDPIVIRNKIVEVCEQTKCALPLAVEQSFKPFTFIASDFGSFPGNDAYAGIDMQSVTRHLNNKNANFSQPLTFSKKIAATNDGTMGGSDNSNLAEIVCRNNHAIHGDAAKMAFKTIHIDDFCAFPAHTLSPVPLQDHPSRASQSSLQHTHQNNLPQRKHSIKHTKAWFEWLFWDQAIFLCLNVLTLGWLVCIWAVLYDAKNSILSSPNHMSSVTFSCIMIGSIITAGIFPIIFSIWANLCGTYPHSKISSILNVS